MVISEQPGSETQGAVESTVDPVLENRKQSVRLLTVVVCALSALLTAGLVVLLFGQFSWQVAVLAGLFAVTTLFCLLALNTLYQRGSYTLGIVGVSLLFGLAVLAVAVFLSGIGFPAAIVYLIFALIVSATTLNDRQANVAIIAGMLIAGLAALATDFSPFPQVTVEIVGILTPAILGVLFMIYMTMQAMQFVTASLRARLVTIFMAIVIVPLGILSLFQSRFMFNELTRETNQAQQQASQQVAYAVDQFIQDTQNSIQKAAQLPILARYLELPEDKRKGSLEEKEMQLYLQALEANELHSNAYLSSFALLDGNGMSLYDTLIDRYQGMSTSEIQVASGQPVQGGSEGEEDYFLTLARHGLPYTSPIYVTDDRHGFFYVTAPIISFGGRTVGVLRARYDGYTLQDFLKTYNGLLGPQSYPILLDNNNIRLADQYTPGNLYKSIAPLSADQIQILKGKHQLPNLPESMLSTTLSDFNQLIDNYQKSPVFRIEVNADGTKNALMDIAAVTRVRTMPWRIVYLRTDFNDEELRLSQRRLTTLVTTIIAGVVGLLAVGAAHLLSRPIMRLTLTARRISEGDLEAQAPSQSSDEFGMLGNAFNSMTSQLRLSIAELEDRVKARTEEIEKQNAALSHRAAQLQTVAEVARQIVSAQELEVFLTSITRLISERFGFYHVGIFLLDEKKENAVLRAANSEGGQRMLARRHSLPVGKVGIVGYATGMGLTRIATDVGEDAAFFNNPDLPDTRSEMALPLKANDQVIGAIDIQSDRSNAFHEEDIELFNTLADQVAIAIHNNQLYMDTRHALEEAENLHRQYLHTEWAQDVAQRKTLGYVFNESGISPQQVENPLWKKVFATGDPLYAVLPGGNGSPEKAVMAVPIAVRGETIGVIHVQDQGENRFWSEDEIAVVNSIANQVAVALENARLFENTVRRAEREKKVLQITARIRSTNDPEEMMRIAVSELQQALNASRTQIYIRQEETEDE